MYIVQFRVYIIIHSHIYKYTNISLYMEHINIYMYLQFRAYIIMHKTYIQICNFKSIYVACKHIYDVHCTV